VVFSGDRSCLPWATGRIKRSNPLDAKALSLGICPRVDAAGGLVEKAVEKRASLALLGDADKKVEPRVGKIPIFAVSPTRW